MALSAGTMFNSSTFDSDALMHPLIKRRLVLFSQVCCIFVIIAAHLVLVGWAYDIEALKGLSTSLVAMNPLTAICFILAGISLWLQRNPAPKYLVTSRILAGIVAVIGFAKLLSLFGDFDFILDRLFFASQLQEPERLLPNRMAPNTAFCFLLAGFSLLLIDLEVGIRKRPAQYLCIAITLVSLLSIYGYVFGVKYLIGISAYIPMAATTAVVFLFLSVGILFSRPDKGSMLIIFGSEETGEALFSRLFAIIFPLMIGWLKLRGEKAGYFSKEFGTALFGISTYAFSMFLLGRNALQKYRNRKLRLLSLQLLQEDAKKLQSILDNTATPIYIKDLEGRYNQVNKRFEQAFKVKSEEIKGKTEYDVFPKTIAQGISATDKEVLEKDATRYLEEVFELEGVQRTFLTVKFTLKDTEGVIYGLCSISTDITDRKLMEVLLRNDERRLNAILSGLGEGVVVVDTSGKFIFFNEIAEDILGLGKTDTAISDWSKTYGTFFPDGKTYYPPEELPLAKGLKGESLDNVEIFIRNENIPDGRAIKVTGRPVYNDKNEIIASVVVCRDITYEKQLEQLIQENEGRLTAVISTIGEGIIVADKNGQFVLFNNKAEEILGMNLKEMSAASWSNQYKIFLPDGLTQYPAEELPLAQALKGKTTNQVELCIRHEMFPKGKSISVSGRPILGDKNQVVAGIVDFRDVTKIRHLEHTLEEIKQKYRELICQSHQRK
ncbi:PAS domain-containing protein [Rufibacter radiotolerans]|nr:PAS domain-containing protein [Rufibacter radiotolerans]